jgi:hypothetical protein
VYAGSSWQLGALAYVQFYGFSVAFVLKTEVEAENHSSRKQEPKPKSKTKKPTFWFGSVRLGSCSW